MEEKTFYDIHMHAMNLSHPNLLAFLQRLMRPVGLLRRLAISGGLLFFWEKILERLQEPKNLLAVMENDLGSFFLLMEACLEENSLLKNDGLHIGGNVYKRIVLTPLMMDFGYKNIANLNIHYSEPTHKLPQKPIIEQVVSVLRGIRFYKNTSAAKIFEIYPFMGLNTKNYSLGQGKKDDLKTMLDKYFFQYNRDRQQLFSAMGILPLSAKDAGDEDIIEAIGNNFFIGIKVYPPLDFDPWPENDPNQLAKVKFLYEYCCKKRIPITTHCTVGGFQVIDDKKASEFTSPKRWRKVLENYSDLKLNFAHFGGYNIPKRAFNEKWNRAILDLISKYENVYADFSFCGVDPIYYKVMRQIIDKAPVGLKEKLLNRIMFGSDFMINLTNISSYNKYFSLFSEDGNFSALEKHKFCCENPGRFLFD